MNYDAAYRDANGRVGRITDVDTFLELIDVPDPDILIGETGDFGIWREDGDGSQRELILAYVPDAGFTIHQQDDEGETRVACVGNSRLSISYDVGGVRAKRPSRAFLDIALTKSVVARFLETGDLSPDVDWVSQYQF